MVGMPALLIVGDADPYRPHIEWLAAHLRHATLCVLKDVGHMPFVELPDDFTRTVAAFLND